MSCPNRCGSFCDCVAGDGLPADRPARDFLLISHRDYGSAAFPIAEFPALAGTALWPMLLAGEYVDQDDLVSARFAAAQDPGTAAARERLENDILAGIGRDWCELLNATLAGNRTIGNGRDLTDFAFQLISAADAADINGPETF